MFLVFQGTSWRLWESLVPNTLTESHRTKSLIYWKCFTQSPTDHSWFLPLRWWLKSNKELFPEQSAVFGDVFVGLFMAPREFRLVFVPLALFFASLGEPGTGYVFVWHLEDRMDACRHVLKGEVSWGFDIFCLKWWNWTINQLPNNSRMTRGKKSTQFLKGTTHDLF